MKRVELLVIKKKRFTYKLEKFLSDHSGGWKSKARAPAWLHYMA